MVGFEYLGCLLAVVTWLFRFGSLLPCADLIVFCVAGLMCGFVVFGDW